MGGANLQSTLRAGGSHSNRVRRNTFALFVHAVHIAQIMSDVDSDDLEDEGPNLGVSCLDVGRILELI